MSAPLWAPSPYDSDHERVWIGPPSIAPVCPCGSTIATVAHADPVTGAAASDGCADCETFVCSLCGRWTSWQAGHGGCARCDECCVRAEGLDGECPEVCS